MAAANSSSHRGLDGEFLSIDKTVPEFGGLFRDEDGTLTVLLTNARAESRARAAVEGFARRNGGGVGEQLRFAKAKYPFRRLAQWKDAALVVLGKAGGVFVDVDEVRNGISVGVESDKVRPGIVARLRDLGIPKDALEVTVSERPSPALSLVDPLTTDHRPTVGGQRIFNMPSEVYCTLGLNVNHAGARRALTNSHCTHVQGGSEHTAFSFGSPIIWFAMEVVDPLYFSCASGPKCRRADVAVIDYTDGSDMTYKIARTTTEGTTGPGSILIGARLPVTARRNSPLINDIVKKTGSSSGTTRGRVSQTCSAVTVSTGFTFLCSSRMDAYSEGGDSGGPVWYDNGTSATATGIMFARISSPVGTYFNDLSAITSDIGTFYVTADNGP